MHLSRTKHQHANSAHGSTAQVRLGRFIVAACVSAFPLLLLPVVADAASPPTLTAPAAAVSPSEGGSIKFVWSGQLGGVAVGQAYWRLEIAAAADVPTGAQAAWPKLDSFKQTNVGADVTTITTGVPSAGSYKWRVCSWGVADASVNQIAQLAGGCSESRAFTAVAAASKDSTIGVVTEERTVKVEQPEQVVTRTRAPVASELAPEVIDIPMPTPVKPASTVTKIMQPVVTKAGVRRSAVSLDGENALQADAATANRRDGVGGAVLGGLSATLPGIPIPFWTLALLGASIPVVRRWRRNVLGMFDWSDDPTGVDDLQKSSDATFVKLTARDSDTPVEFESQDTRAA
ncbi:MAG: hypothetical protein H7287_08415 [Thermoleophilia bacterium]|nr:hypothetical protein [Thermoleophilia bacterium]